MPIGRRVVGPRHATKSSAARRADELVEINAERWPVDLVVCKLGRDQRIAAAYMDNPQAQWGKRAERWASQSLEAIPQEVGKPDAVGALLTKSELTRGELGRLAQMAAGPDPERSRAAKQRIAVQHAIAAALESHGAAAMPSALVAGARRDAYEAVAAGASVDAAVQGALDAVRDAAAAVAKDGPILADAFAEAAELEEDPGRRALLEGAADYAAAAPDVCLSPPGEAGELGDGTPLIWGSATPLSVPSQAGGVRTYPAQYALIDVGQVMISHDPASFRPTLGYPSGLQERDYQRDQSEQVKVVQGANNLQPELVINTASEATSGPPVIADGPAFVLGGNSRSMIIARVIATGPDNGYTEALQRELGGCTTYGLAGDQVTPTSMLVRVILGEFDPVSISRALNLGFTATAGAAARAVSVGAVLPRQLLELLAVELLEEDLTLSRALARRGADVIRLLRDADVITPQTAPLWQATRSGRLVPQLSAEGRQMLRDALLGRLLGDKEALSLTSPRLEDLYERAAPALLALEEVAQ